MFEILDKFIYLIICLSPQHTPTQVEDYIPTQGQLFEMLVGNFFNPSHLRTAPRPPGKKKHLEKLNR